MSFISCFTSARNLALVVESLSITSLTTFSELFSSCCFNIEAAISASMDLAEALQFFRRSCGFGFSHFLAAFSQALQDFILTSLSIILPVLQPTRDECPDKLLKVRPLPRRCQPASYDAAIPDPVSFESAISFSFVALQDSFARASTFGPFPFLAF